MGYVFWSMCPVYGEGIGTPGWSTYHPLSGLEYRHPTRVHTPSPPPGILTPDPSIHPP